jgi:hypothetical protein
MLLMGPMPFMGYYFLSLSSTHVCSCGIFEDATGCSLVQMMCGICMILLEHCHFTFIYKFSLIKFLKILHFAI